MADGNRQALKSAGSPAFRFAALDAAVRERVGSLYPGAVLMIGGRNGIVHAAAFGHARTFTTDEHGAVHPLPRPTPMRTETIFDLASITKVAATTVAIMRLVDRKRLALDDSLAELLPGFSHTDKAGITVRHLLAHRAGLWEWQPTWLHRDVCGYLAALPLRYSIGERYAYSDLGFMLLGEIVARVSGMPFDRFVRDEIHRPLGMIETGFRPPVARCAATSPGDGYQRRMAETGIPFPSGPIMPPPGSATAYRTHVLIGEANDANAALGWSGIAGHAGLFAPAADLLRLTRALIDADPLLAARETIARFEAMPFDPVQALGFRVFAGRSATFFGHTGFTGTFLAYSRDLSIEIALLTNRIHRDDRDGAPPPALTDLHDLILSDVGEVYAE